jgi:hypothetical protein
MRLRIALLAVLVTAAVYAAAAHGAATVAIFTIAGGDGHGFAGDGQPATSATLDGPAGVLAMPDGAILVADTIDQRIRRIDPSGRIRTIAGNGKRGFSGDGGRAAAASFQDPTALALGKDGSVFVADTGNSRIRVLRPDGTIATVAGTADQGFSGDGGPATAAQIDTPQGLATGADGTLYFSDAGNNRVRAIRGDGAITTVAGSGTAGFAGDAGPATTAALNAPAGLAVAGDGALLVADTGNNRVRRVGPDGRITTVAGSGGGGSGGDGGKATTARLNTPVDVAALAGGGFLVSEAGGHRVRQVNASGDIARLAGTGAPRYGGDGGPPASGRLNAPGAVELLPSGFEVLIADTDNNRIRYVAVPGQASHLALAPLRASVRAPLKKKTIVAKQQKRRVLIVSDVAVRLRVTKEADIVTRIVKKRGKQVALLRSHTGPGAGVIHLPAALRSGNRRLTKGHYVLRMSANAGNQSATASLELIVK